MMFLPEFLETMTWGYFRLPLWGRFVEKSQEFVETGFQGMVSGKGQCRGTTAGKGTTILAATIGRIGSV